MHTHGTAVLSRPADVIPATLLDGGAVSRQVARREPHFAEALPATTPHPLPTPADPVNDRSPDSCPDCGGTGVMNDSDGSLTSMIGWPIPCFCTDHMPADTRQHWLRDIMTAIPPFPHHNAALSAPLSRSGL